jgi:hypothetical protein
VADMNTINTSIALNAFRERFDRDVSEGQTLTQTLVDLAFQAGVDGNSSLRQTVGDIARLITDTGEQHAVFSATVDGRDDPTYLFTRRRLRDEFAAAVEAGGATVFTGVEQVNGETVTRELIQIENTTNEDE